MNSLGALALRYLKVNKRQSFFIVVCASLSVALCTFFLTVFSSGLATVRENVAALNGSWHGSIKLLTEEQAQKIAANAAFSDVQIQKQIVPKEKFDNYEHFLYAGNSEELIDWNTIYSAENDPDALYSPKLFSGRFPENPYEIVLPTFAGQSIGDKITVSINTHERIGIDYPGKLVKSYEKVYTVCGISGQDNYYYTFIHMDDDFFENKANMEVKYNLFVRFNDRTANYRTILLDMCEKEGIPIQIVDKTFIQHPDVAPSYYFDALVLNHYLAIAELSGSEAIADTAVYFALMCIFVLIILAFGRVVIDCEFQQIAASKQHDVGLLMAIGATDKQLYAVSIFEGLILGAAAVPMGLILGTSLVALAVKLLNGIFYMRDILTEGVVLEINPLLLLMAAVMGIGWVFLSSYGIGVGIKKVNPVEAMEGVRKSGRSPFPEQNAKNPELYKKLHAAFILTPVKKEGKSKSRIMLTPFDKLSPENFLQKLSAAVARIERRRFLAASASMAMGIALFSTVFFTLRMMEEDVRANWYDGEIPTEETANMSFSALAARLMPIEEGNGFFSEKISEAKEQGIILSPYDSFRKEPYFKFRIDNMAGGVERYSKETFEEKFGSYGIDYEEAVKENYVFVLPYYTGDNDEQHTDPPVITIEKAVLNVAVHTINGINGYVLWGQSENGFEEISKEITAVFINKGEGSQKHYGFIDENNEETFSYTEVITGFRVSENLLNEVTEEAEQMYSEIINDYAYFTYANITLEQGTNRQNAEKWIRENIGPYSVRNSYSEPFEYVIVKVIGTILTITAALIAFANAVNVTMSGILENRRGFALMRAAGMTDKQLESSALRQAAEPVIWAAVIAFVLASIMITTVWGNYGNLSLFSLFIGFLAYFIGVAVTLGVSLLAALPAIREIEDEEIAVAVKPMVE
ncbi:MAG: ABC transporter permease [Oscillospiraceae bacterium]|nr:ABC transporter permease [Oscillospiraceae bacterium]